MLKTRLLLIAVSALIIFLLFQLPKSVVENETRASGSVSDSVASHIEAHVQAPADVRNRIARLRAMVAGSTENEKNAIFADSLADLYKVSNRFDSAAWFAGDAARVFNTVAGWQKAGDLFYQAYSVETDEERQKAYASQAQGYFNKVLEREPANLDVKTKAAMTYITTATPMQGISMLREVLKEDPRHELALFNMGMLSIQSGQNERAIDWLRQLVEVNPQHIQGQLLLGIAWLNKGDKRQAREQLEKVKQMDKDPAVQATVDSYLKDLK